MRHTESARSGKTEGVLVMLVQVDQHGKAKVKRVLRPLGYGLDEEAVQAVQRWLFRPADENGKPIPMERMVEVEFRLK